MLTPRLGIAVTWYCSLLLASLNGWDGNHYLRSGAFSWSCTLAVARVLCKRERRHSVSPSRTAASDQPDSECVWATHRYRDLSYSIWGPFGFYATVLFQQVGCIVGSDPAVKCRPTADAVCLVSSLSLLWKHNQ